MEVHPGVFVYVATTDWQPDLEVGGGAEEHVLFDTGAMRAGLTRFPMEADPAPLVWELEPGSATLDEVELLVLPILIVLVDDPVSCLATRPRVDPERRDAEVVAHRTPGAATIADLADLLQVGDRVLAHRHSSRSLSSLRRTGRLSLTGARSVQGHLIARPRSRGDGYRFRDRVASIRAARSGSTMSGLTSASRTSSRRLVPVRTRIVVRPARFPPLMSAARLSPTIATRRQPASSDWAMSKMNRSGFPTVIAVLPPATSTEATTAPVPGQGPSGIGKVASRPGA